MLELLKQERVDNTMSLFDEIRQGSYRGVNFDTFSWDRTKVKKNTKHQYANSNRRYIEERGVEEADFTLTLSIFGNDDYIEKRDALRKALDEEGEGLLVIPLEGEFNVKCLGYSDSQNIIEGFGRCDFKANFSVISKNELQGNPIQIKNSKISLANRVKLLRENLATMVNSNVLISNATSYAQGVDKVANFADKMVQIAGMVGNSSLSDMIKNFASNIPVFFGGNVGILGSAISTLFYTFESVCDTASLLFSSSETLFDFGDTDVKVSPNTPERLEQKKNAGVLNTQIQASALGSAMDAFANTDFENEEDLKIAEDKILNQIDKILNSDTLKDSSLEGVEDIKYYLKQIQVDFSDVIAEKELITPKLTTIDVRGESISLIAYKYYDKIDNASALIDLNNIQDPKVVNGSIRIFDNVG